MTDEITDRSRVDAYAATRRRAMLAHSLWRPLLAGAAGAALVIIAVALAAPRFAFREMEVPRITYRETEVPRITTREVQVDRLIPHDVEIAVPRLVEPAPATPSPLARTPQEEGFTTTPAWRGAIVKGRILRADGLGFVMQTDEGEKSFFPARVGVDGKIEPNPSMRDDVRQALGHLAYCRQTPTTAYQCTALGRDGREVEIPQIPIGDPL